jgi:hypothetical protein
MTNKAYFLPKRVLTPQKEISSQIFKMTIFSSHEPHDKDAGKKMKQFLNVSPLTIVDILLLPF